MKLTDQARAWVQWLSAASQGGSIRFRKVLPEIYISVTRELTMIPRRRLTIAGTASALLFCGTVALGCQAVHHTPEWNQVYTNGSLVGMVPQRRPVTNGMQRTAVGYHISLKFVPIHTMVPSSYNWRFVASLPTQATSIRLNGTTLVYTTGKAVALRVLSEVKRALTPPGSTQAHFNGQVTIVAARVPVTRVVTEQTATRLLLGSGTNSQSAARSRSLLSSIETNHTVHPVRGLPAASHSRVTVPSGQHSKTTAESNQPPLRLHVLSAARVTRVVHVAAPVRYVDNPDLSQSVQKVLNPGVAGTVREQVEVHYVDSQVSSEHVVSQQTMTSAQPEVIERGTNPGTAVGAWVWPTDTTVITSPFGPRYLNGAYDFHPGVDIGCPIGSPIYATNNGIVEDAGWNNGGYGDWVRINNGDGIESVFGHMSQVVVASGQTVAKGELIGYSGDTGEATGPHLHYEVRKWGTPIPPEPYM